jgi:hypothetical protein
MDWQDRRAEWKANKAMADRFKPLDDAEKARKVEAANIERARAIDRDARAAVQRTLDTAVKHWPGFEANGEAIHAHMVANKYDVPTAYITFMAAQHDAEVAKLKEAVTAARDTAMKELKGAPSGTSVRQAAPAVVAQPHGSTRMTADIVAEAVRNGGR